MSRGSPFLPTEPEPQWRGKPVRDLSREQLIEAVIQMGEMIDTLYGVLRDLVEARTRQ